MIDKYHQFQSDLEAKPSQDWSLVSERSLYRDIRAGSTFQLRQGDVSLLCTVKVRYSEHIHLNCYALYNCTRVPRFKSPINDLNKSKIAGPAALQHPRGDHRRRLQQVRPQAQLGDLGVKGVQTTWQHCTKP